MKKMNSVEPCGHGNQHGEADLIVAQAFFQNRSGRHTSTPGPPEPLRWKASIPFAAAQGKSLKVLLFLSATIVICFSVYAIKVNTWG